MVLELTLPDGVVDPAPLRLLLLPTAGAIVASIAALRHPHPGRRRFAHQFNTRTAKHYFCSVCGITHHQRRQSGGIWLTSPVWRVSPFDLGGADRDRVHHRRYRSRLNAVTAPTGGGGRARRCRACHSRDDTSGSSAGVAPATAVTYCPVRLRRTPASLFISSLCQQGTPVTTASALPDLILRGLALLSRPVPGHTLLDLLGWLPLHHLLRDWLYGGEVWRPRPADGSLPLHPRRPAAPYEYCYMAKSPLATLNASPTLLVFAWLVVALVAVERLHAGSLDPGWQVRAELVSIAPRCRADRPRIGGQGQPAGEVGSCSSPPGSPGPIASPWTTPARP